MHGCDLVTTITPSPLLKKDYDKIGVTKVSWKTAKLGILIGRQGATIAEIRRASGYANDVCRMCIPCMTTLAARNCTYMPCDYLLPSLTDM